MIELHRVSKVYSVGPVKVPALSDVSLRINKGEFVVLTGASGAGKTTLLRLLYRDDLPSDGDIEVFGYELGKLKHRDVAALRRSIDRKSTRLNSSHANISYAVFCLKKKKKISEKHSQYM